LKDISEKRRITIVTFYQQPGDAKNPYFAQYSAVVSEDAPVKASYTTIKNNIAIKNILKLLNIHFNEFVMEVFLARADNIIITEDLILSYIILIIYFFELEF
jgi:hypothetical protein